MAASKRPTIEKASGGTVFGQIKQARGFRQFLLRGVEKVRPSGPLTAPPTNLLKLFNLATPRRPLLCNK